MFFLAVQLYPESEKAEPLLLTRPKIAERSTHTAMFQDALLLKTQLFHTVWPAVDIIPYQSMADTSLDMSLGANSSVNYYPVSSESTVSPARCALRAQPAQCTAPSARMSCAARKCGGLAG